MKLAVARRRDLIMCNSVDSSETVHWEHPSPTFQRSTEVWYDDGNVILVADQKGFKIVASILSSHASVFADMFFIPTPKSELIHDGCSVVDLPDSAQDLEVFLKVLFNVE